MRDPALTKPIVAAFVLVACLSGCTGPSGGASGSPPSASSGSAGPSGPSDSIDVSVPAGVLDPVIADAASRAGVAATAVTVVAASAQTWPNGALGCPTPGTVYTQAVVTGWQVVVEAAGARFDYRSSGPGRFRLCSGGPPGPSGSNR